MRQSAELATDLRRSAPVPGAPRDGRGAAGGTRRVTLRIGESETTGQDATYDGLGHDVGGDAVEPELGPAEEPKGTGAAMDPREVDETPGRWSLDIGTPDVDATIGWGCRAFK